MYTDEYKYSDDGALTPSDLTPLSGETESDRYTDDGGLDIAPSGMAVPAPTPIAPPIDDGTVVGLGLQLQEPDPAAPAGGGFRVVKLIRGAPSDLCGLICEGDTLVGVDGRTILTSSFAEVSSMLRGPEGSSISLDFERAVREHGATRTRSFEAMLRRERFFLPAESEDEGESDGALESYRPERTGTKADYWEGYRAAMAQKVPAWAGSVASFESDESDISELGELPPPSPGGASLSASEPGEPETDARLAGALAAGTTVGLQERLLPALPTEAELLAAAEADAADDAALRTELGATAAKWSDQLGKWSKVLGRAQEGLCVKSELLSVWRLKVAALRAKVGVDDEAVDAQVRKIADAPLPPPRQSAERTAAVLEAVREGASGAPAELLQELQRQMVESERWRAEASKMGALLKTARADLGAKSAEMATLRAQNITWSSDNRQKRAEARAAADELGELKEAHGAVLAQASMWEDRCAKLQEEVKLKGELAAMWRRSAEKGGAGEGSGEAEAAAITWKIEAERATHESVRWREASRKAEEAMAAQGEEATRLRVQCEALRAQLEAERAEKVAREADVRPQEQIDAALNNAREDLHAKSEEAERLRAKVARLEHAIKTLM